MKSICLDFQNMAPNAGFEIGKFEGWNWQEIEAKHKTGLTNCNNAGKGSTYTNLTY